VSGAGGGCGGSAAERARSPRPGGDKVIELVESDDESVFLCLLCNFLVTRLDCMLAHMTQLDHIDNYAVSGRFCELGVQARCEAWLRST